jgi:hypothetical protein
MRWGFLVPAGGPLALVNDSVVLSWLGTGLAELRGSWLGNGLAALC